MQCMEYFKLWLSKSYFCHFDSMKLVSLKCLDLNSYLQCVYFFCLIMISLFFDGSFENEALENEDRSTKQPNLENEAPKSRKRSTLNSKTKHPRSKTKHPKTRHRSVLYKHETNVNTAEIKRDNEYSITNRMQFKSTQVVNAFPPLRGRPGGRLCFGRDQIPTIEPDPRLLP